MAAAVVGDVLANATRLYIQFRQAEREAQIAAHELAEACDRLRAPYRVIAHSLGCRLVLEAMPLLPATKRPVEVHLCAAAVTEEQAAPSLLHLCAPREISGNAANVWLYFSHYDEVLATAFRCTSMGDVALGLAPLSQSIRGVRSVDVTGYFGLLHHTEYRFKFDQLALGALRHQLPPPPLSSWHVAQSMLLRDRLAQSLQSLTLLPRSAANRWRRATIDGLPDVRAGNDLVSVQQRRQKT